MAREWFPILDRLQEGMSLLDELLNGDLQSVSKYLLPLVNRGWEATHTATHTAPLKEGGETMHITPFKEGSQASAISEGGESSFTLLEGWSSGMEVKVKH